MSMQIDHLEASGREVPSQYHVGGGKAIFWVHKYDVSVRLKDLTLMLHYDSRMLSYVSKLSKR